MNKRERIIAAINHRDGDKMPHNMEFTAEELQKLIDFTGDKDFYRRLDNHIAACGSGRFQETAKDRFRDEFGVVWNREKDKDIGVIDNILIPDADNVSYKLPEIDYKLLEKNIGNHLRGVTDEFVVFNIGFSMFERAWTLRGMENLLIDFIENPKFCESLLSDICEYNLKQIDFALKYDRIDGIMFGDDWGQQKGLIMGGNFWRKYIKPNVKRMYARAKAKGRFVLQHSCGDITEIFPDLIDIGLDVYQTFQPEIYDIADIKKTYGGSLTFWGGISTQHVLPHGTPQEVEAVAKRTIDVMYRSGGYIAAPTHAMPKDIPCENVLKLLDVFKTYK